MRAPGVGGETRARSWGTAPGRSGRGQEWGAPSGAPARSARGPAEEAGVGAWPPATSSQGTAPPRRSVPADGPGFEWEPGGSGAACGPEGRPGVQGSGGRGVPRGVWPCFPATSVLRARRLRAARRAPGTSPYHTGGYGSVGGWRSGTTEGAALTQKRRGGGDRWGMIPAPTLQLCA